MQKIEGSSPFNRFSSMTDLAHALGAEPPAALAALDDARQQQLAEALVAAQERQAAAIDAAAERGLGFVPRLLRGPVKRMLF